MLTVTVEAEGSGKSTTRRPLPGNRYSVIPSTVATFCHLAGAIFSPDRASGGNRARRQSARATGRACRDGSVRFIKCLLQADRKGQHTRADDISLHCRGARAGGERRGLALTGAADFRIVPPPRGG